MKKRFILSLLSFFSTGFAQTLPNFHPLTHLPPFQKSHFHSMPSLWDTYLKWYGFDSNKITLSRAGIVSGSVPLMAYEFTPRHPKGSVILLHGYLSHTADFSTLINYLCSMNYRVLAFDLPGHGLSGGKRTAIDDFADYRIAYQAFLSAVSNEILNPLFFIGHSTGCAADLELIANHPLPVRFKTHIWLAPLVRLSSWQLAQIGYRLLKPVTDEIPRVFIPTTSNPKFNRFIEHSDPLQARMISTSWVKALFKWDNINQSYNQIRESIVVIQGTDDHVVDWHYNLEYYKKRMTHYQVFFIKNAKHHLAVEALPYRQKVFSIISNILISPKKSDLISEHSPEP